MKLVRWVPIDVDSDTDNDDYDFDDKGNDDYADDNGQHGDDDNGEGDDDDDNGKDGDDENEVRMMTMVKMVPRPWNKPEVEVVAEVAVYCNHSEARP